MNISEKEKPPVQVFKPTPTVGRFVAYITTQKDRDRFAHLTSHGAQNNISYKLPAIITEVWSDTCVNIQVIVDGVMGTMWKISVDEGEDEGNWSWPVIQNAPVKK